MFHPAAGSVKFPELEASIGAWWKKHAIYQKSLARRAGAPRFVFYEGPPTANGLPHPGHCLTRAIKDVFPRYRTMRGYLCERKAGWDTHGLPVEVEVCKELGIHSKEEIEAYGVEPFIHKCLESVFRYTQQWERLTERLGFWVNLDQAYVTYHQSYVESVWWSLKTLFDAGLLYQGHKIVWWWAQGGTALSSGEVGQGYREVADPSVYVRFDVLASEQAQQLGLSESSRHAPRAATSAKNISPPPAVTNVSLLVWTTTPWTLPSNQFAAVHPELEYALVTDPERDHKLIVAAALVADLSAKAGRELAVERTFRGSQLIGLGYQPPFDYYYGQPAPSAGGPAGTLGQLEGQLKDGGRQRVAWRVVAADFVTIDSGTGVVHQAPAFGEVDYQVLISEQARFTGDVRPELICAVGPDGKFTADAPDYQGRWVKEADKDISRELRRRGLLYHQEQYLHEYPFCWRAEEDPLIQYPRESWFIRTSQFKEAMLANNARINWLPEHIRDGRFGNFLATNVDWALSRERYWGTPLPIWQCEKTGRQEAVANYADLLAKPGVAGTEAWAAAKQANPQLSEHLKVHKPYIDAVTYDSPYAPGARMRRVPEVIDCWFDSGAMPFAQWGYPQQGREQFQQQFPADFISEAIDQTRGWFYSQLAISTLLFGEHGKAVSQHEYPHPFRNCIVLGLMLGEDGQKMSKSKRNYREPNEIFDRYGADALRWYFFANQPPWTSIRYSEQAIKDSIPEFLLRLWNVYSFFVIYANIDGFDPAAELAAGGKQHPLEQLTPAELAAGASFRPRAQRSELDRWILGELDRAIAGVIQRMDAYDNYGACQLITAYVDALSNWYVRRSRDRFWHEDKRDRDKLDAYWTLYECLLSTTKLVAPFVPFLAEALWQNLAVAPFDSASDVESHAQSSEAAGCHAHGSAWACDSSSSEPSPTTSTAPSHVHASVDMPPSLASPPSSLKPPASSLPRLLPSVHLCDYPTAEPTAEDAVLSERMALVREVVSLGRAARMNAKLKVRQPLAKVEVILANRAQQPWLATHADLIAEELNVKQVEFTEQADHYISYTVLPDLKRLGPRLGKQLPALKTALAQADAGALLAQLEAARKVELVLPGGSVALDSEDLQIRLQAKPGWAAAQGPGCVVVLSTEVTEELVQEGLAREIVHAVQNIRKDMECQYTDRIEVGLVTDDANLLASAERFADYLSRETLTVRLVYEPLSGVTPAEVKIGSAKLQIYVRVAK